MKGNAPVGTFKVRSLTGFPRQKIKEMPSVKECENRVLMNHFLDTDTHTDCCCALATLNYDDHCSDRANLRWARPFLKADRRVLKRAF